MEARELYNQHASGTHAEFTKLLLNGLREHIDRLAEISKTVYALHPQSVLDVPCNMGLITSLVSMYLNGPKRVVGVDVSDEYVRMAREYFNVNAIQADMLTYQPDEKFELVMCMEMLEHVPNPEDYVKKACELSSKWVLISVPIEAEPVDGEIHVRKVHPTELWDWLVGAGAHVARMWTLPSAFCEKPKWLGWMFALGEIP